MSQTSKQLQELPMHSITQACADPNSSAGAREAAAQVLLQHQPAAAAAAAAAPGRSHHRSPQARPVTPPAGNHTWAALRHTAGAQHSSSSSSAPASPKYAQHRSPPAPVFVRQRGQAPPPPKLTADAFPSLAGTSNTAMPASGTRAGMQKHAHLMPLNGGVRRSISAPSFAETARNQQLLRQQQQQLEHHRLQQQHRPEAQSPSQQPHHQQQQQQQQRWPHPQHDTEQLVKQLAQLHPWCEPDLLQEVLASVEHDPAAAAAALAQLAPADIKSQAMGSSQSYSNGRSAEAKIAAGSSDRVSVPFAPATISGSHNATNNQQQQQQPLLPQQQEPGSGDIYHEVRRQALRLTRQWHKVRRRASAASAAGDRSAAQEMHSEAASLKQAADAAHAAAALKIEVLHNMDSLSGLWQLDLHGLHVGEALQALQQRLELLQDMVQDLTAQAHPAAAAAAAAPAGPEDADIDLATSRVAATTTSSSSSRRHVLTQLLLCEDQPLHVRQAAMSQQLRVIVGRGNHSSAGEASLPRAVEQWLTDAQYKHVVRPGAIDVRLKRFQAI